MKLEPWQVDVLERVMSGQRLAVAMPRRHSLSEFDSDVKRIYRLLGYEIVYGRGWWGVRQPECASPE